MSTFGQRDLRSERRTQNRVVALFTDTARLGTCATLACRKAGGDALNRELATTRGPMPIPGRGKGTP